MANPPSATVDTTLAYPVFTSKDTAGTRVTPSGGYVWNSTTGLWVPWPTDANGNPQVAVTGSNATKITSDGTASGNAVAITSAFGFNDTVSNNLEGIVVNPYNMAFNGSTWDRVRNNTQGTLLASAARTATIISPTQINYNSRGVMLALNVTAVSGTGGLTVYIRMVEPVSGSYISLAASSSVTATGLYLYELFPGSTTAAMGGVNNITQRFSAALPRSWVGEVSVGDSSSYTYSLGYALIN